MNACEETELARNSERLAKVVKGVYLLQGTGKETNQSKRIQDASGMAPKVN